MTSTITKTNIPERYKAMLVYDPASGELRWGPGAVPRYRGRPAGCLRPDGYRVVRLDGVLHYAHRVVWELAHGRPPDGEIDHVNGDPGDNRIVNLRVVDRAGQTQNGGWRRTNTTGYRGVSRTPEGRFKARIHVRGRQVNIGHFDVPADAEAAYLVASERLHGDHGYAARMTRHG